MGQGGAVGASRWSFEHLLALPPGVIGAERRRARTLLAIATALAAAAIPVGLMVGFLLPDPVRNVPVVLMGLGYYFAIRTLIGRSHFTLAAWVFLSYFIIVPINGLILGDGPFPADALFIVVIPVLAAVVLPVRHVLVATGIASLELVVVSRTARSVQVSIDDLSIYIAIVLAIVGSAAIVLTVIVDSAFDEATQTRVESQRLADELQVANSELEARVRSRTTELADALQREQQLSAQLGELSVRDSLTGLHNRRHMDDTIDRMFRYALRSEHPLSVAIIDLDDFKRINDRHTHLVGDQVLKKAASLLAAGIRGSDELVRMGGEEFALLMPGTTSAEAITVCDRMRCSLAQHDWSSIVSGIAVTASFGIATTGASREVSELVRTADEQLLKAKRSGKNRVICAAAEVA